MENRTATPTAEPPMSSVDHAFLADMGARLSREFEDTVTAEVVQAEVERAWRELAPGARVPAFLHVLVENMARRQLHEMRKRRRRPQHRHHHAPHVGHLQYGAISIDGTAYHDDVVIDHGQVHRRHKKPSKRFRRRYGHTPLSAREHIPWECQRLVVGTGIDGALPVMDEVRQEAARRGIELVALPTADAVEVLHRNPEGTNAILHVAC